MIQIIITTACFTVWWAVLSAIPQRLRLRKPFDCVVCLPVYLAPVLYFVPPTYMDIITVASVAPVAAWTLHGILQFIKQNLNGNY